MTDKIKKDETKVEEVNAPIAEAKDLKTPPEAPRKREILILTDGNSVELKKAETSGKIELIAIFQNLINYLSQPEK